MPIELRLAAIIALLSSSALRGATVGKVEVLRGHLEAAALEVLMRSIRACAGCLRTPLRNGSRFDYYAQSVAVDHCPLAARLLH